MNVEDKIREFEKRIAVLESIINSPVPAATTTLNKKTSLREFLINKKPSDDVKKTLAIGYYLEKLGGLDSFNVSDLLGSFEKAKEKKPLNINDKVNMNIKKGHMDEVSKKKDDKKAWHLTSSGELFVENNFWNR